MLLNLDEASAAGSLKGRADRGGRGCVVPVVTADSNKVLANILASESEAVVGERAIDIVEVLEVAGNIGVVADLVGRDTLEVVGEPAERSVELLEDDSLHLNLADLLGDDLLRHFLQNDEALLDDFDAHSAADDLLLLDDNLLKVLVGEVVDTIEVVEALKGVEASPVVKRNVLSAACNAVIPVAQRGRHYSGDQSRESDEREEQLGEHVDSFKKSRNLQ